MILGGTLAEAAFHEFSLNYMKRIVAALHKTWDGERIPSIVFTKGGGLWLEALADTGADGLGLDWTIDIGKARARVGERVALQGNLDPTILRAGPEAVAREAERVLRSFGPANTGHVFNLGHGISQFTPGERFGPRGYGPCGGSLDALGPLISCLADAIWPDPSLRLPMAGLCLSRRQSRVAYPQSYPQPQIADLSFKYRELDAQPENSVKKYPLRHR